MGLELRYKILSKLRKFGIMPMIAAVMISDICSSFIRNVRDHFFNTAKSLSHYLKICVEKFKTLFRGNVLLTSLNVS